MDLTVIVFGFCITDTGVFAGASAAILGNVLIKIAALRFLPGTAMTKMNGRHCEEL